MHLIVGAGRTGRSVERWLTEQGLPSFLFDDNLNSNLEIPWNDILSVIVSPGIPFKNPVYQEAIKRNIPIESDMHLFQRVYPNHRYIGITGSNGKSTTSSLLAHLLKDSRPTLLSGNIGIPVLDRPPTSNQRHTIVWELSSFHLNIGKPLKIDVGVYLNLSPNHLDRHGTMEAYHAAKQRVFAHSEFGFIGSNNQPPVCPFWRLKDQFKIDEQDQKIHILESVFDWPKYLPGIHNAENAAFALAIAIQEGVSPEECEKQLHTFQPLEHRTETVWQSDKQCIVNDSKSTNDLATRVAFEAFKGQPIWWIAGGKPKAGGIESLAPYFEHLQHIYLIGESTALFADTLQKNDMQNVTQSGTLDVAVDQALRDIQDQPGVLLFSPACASFDQFKDFEHRGRVFKDIINQHKKLNIHE